MQHNTGSLPFPSARRGIKAPRLRRLFPVARLISGLQRSLQGKPIPAFDVALENGAVHRFRARAADDAPAFTLHLRDDLGLQALASLDEPSIAEAYVTGHIDIEGDFLSALDLRSFFSDRHPLRSIWRFVIPLIYGRLRADKRWVPQHYDNGNDFYFSFLDRRRRMYSQALYRSETETLDEAVDNKLAYISEICRLKPGDRVLDIGGGWGSFGLYAAERGVNVTMLTLSREQFAYLSQLAESNTLPGRIEPVLESIFAFNSPEPFDAVVTLGVMEHLPDYEALFARLKSLLRVGGRVYMDFSAIKRKFGISSFTYRYVFPGNHSPVFMPDLVAAANDAPFELIAAHNDRHSYFLTLREWARRLEAAHDELARGFGETTYRLFRLYLWATAHCLGRDGALESYRVVFQHGAGQPSTEIGL
jgi:cyclopropane-fatty-acyl-phospholipid synthase